MKSLEKALDIIEIVSEYKSMGVREIGTRVGFPPATTHRILTTLVKRGYLHQDQSTKTYSLASRFLELGDRASRQFDLVPIARPFLEKLETETKENANLTVRIGWEVVYIDHVHSNEHGLQSFTRLGARVPLYCCGVGKIFLSWLSQTEFEDYIREVNLIPFTAYTIDNPSKLRDELSKIKELGYALDDQEKELGIRCVAAPIHGYKGDILASISISGATQRITKARVPALAKSVVLCAQQISAELGGAPI